MKFVYFLILISLPLISSNLAKYKASTPQRVITSRTPAKNTQPLVKTSKILPASALVSQTIHRYAPTFVVHKKAFSTTPASSGVKDLTIKSWETKPPSWSDNFNFNYVKKFFMHKAGQAPQEKEKTVEAQSFDILQQFLQDNNVFIPAQLLNLPIYLPRTHKPTTNEIDIGALSDIVRTHAAQPHDQGYVSTNLTFLKLAILFNRNDIVQKLLEAGADSNFTPIKTDKTFFEAESTSSPLWLAADLLNVDAFKLLVNQPNTDLSYVKPYAIPRTIDNFLELERVRLTKALSYLAGQGTGDLTGQRALFADIEKIRTMQAALAQAQTARSEKYIGMD